MSKIIKMNEIKAELKIKKRILIIEEEPEDEEIKQTVTTNNLYDFMVINEWDEDEKSNGTDGFSYEQNYKLGLTDEMSDNLHDKMFQEIRLNYENFNAERSCMWVEEVKRRAKWVLGETIYGDNREKHMTYPIWWSRDKEKIGCPAFIIEADGYVSIHLFNGYTMNETKHTKKVNYIRPSCLYNDKNTK